MCKCRFDRDGHSSYRVSRVRFREGWSGIGWVTKGKSDTGTHSKIDAVRVSVVKVDRVGMGPVEEDVIK